MDNFDLKKYLAEGKLNENMFDFDVATTEKIAQKVADAFTADDDLDLKYVVNPRIGAGEFDLDVEAGFNTPDQDSLGQDIDNYLGEFAGGSFYIKDGVVYNAAMRNAPVANVTPEGEVEMISAEDSRAAIGMDDEIDMDRYNDDLDMKGMEENKYNPDLDQDDEEVPMPMDDEGRPLGENKNELKLNKMKKSELKEMIKSAFLEEANLNIKDETNMYDPVDEGMINETTAMEFMELLPTVAGGMAALIGSSLGVTVFMEKAKEGKYGAKIQKLAQGLESVGSTAAGARNVAEQEDVEVEDDENVDVNVEKDVEVDVDDESTETDTVVKTELPGEGKDVEQTLGLLTKAQETAKALGDEKLTDQIGNTITYFTRAHVARQSVNESIEFPMWNKIK